MAPVATTTTTTEAPAPATLKLRPQGAESVDPGKSRLDGPMKYNGLLDSYAVSIYDGNSKLAS